MGGRILYKFTQRIFILAAYLTSRVFSDTRVIGRENIRGIKKGPILIICNHKSYIDSSYLGSCFSISPGTYPLRFMAEDTFFKKPWSWLLFRLVGAFPAYRKQGIDKSLMIPAKLLRSGEMVVIFPEGRCFREDGLGPPRQGAAALASRFPDVPIVPIAMKGTHKVLSGMLHFRRQKAYIGIGRPFLLSECGALAGDDAHAIDELSAKLMARVAEVYNALPVT